MVVQIRPIKVLGDVGWQVLLLFQRKMWKLLAFCFLVLVTEILGTIHTRRPKSLGRGAGRMRGRGVASLGSRQRGAIRRFLAALTGEVDEGR